MPLPVEIFIEASPENIMHLEIRFYRAVQYNIETKNLYLYY